MVAVQAINNNGRVVGVYTDAGRNVQSVFLYNGSQVSSFGKFSPNDVVNASLNDKGAMLVSDYSASKSMGQTWRVLCDGSGC